MSICHKCKATNGHKIGLYPTHCVTPRPKERFLGGKLCSYNPFLKEDCLFSGERSPLALLAVQDRVLTQ